MRSKVVFLMSNLTESESSPRLFTFKSLNLSSLSSEFLDSLEDFDVEIPSKFNDLIVDFNDRMITPTNINDMIRFCDYLLLENTEEFIVKNSLPTLDSYDLDEDNRYKIFVPCFLVKSTIWDSKKNGWHKVNVLDDDNEFSKRKISYSISEYNLLKWLTFIVEKKGLDFICLEGILMGGSIECLKMIHQLGVPLVHQNIGPNLVEENIRPNQVLYSIKNLECLQYVYQNGCTYETNINSHEYGRECSNYSRLGSLDCLRFAREKKFPWTDQTTLEASRKCLKCLQYAIQEGCPYNLKNCGFEAARHGKLDCLKYLVQLGLEVDPSFTLLGGIYLPILQFLHELGCPFHEKTIDESSKYINRIDALKYALLVGCPVFDYQLVNAAFSGNLKAIEILLKHGAAWTPGVCAAAAGGGHLEILKYAHENHLEWDSSTCSNSALSIKLECLKFAVNNGCPMNINTSISAVEGGSLECLKFVIENGCPFNTKTIDLSFRYEDKTLFDYLLSKGCPMSKRTRKKALKKGYKV